MVRLWAVMIKYGYKTIEDCPDRYLVAVKKELGIEDKPKEVAEEAQAIDAEPTQENAEVTAQ